MKGQTLGDMFPKGLCFLCLKPCHPNGIIHYECAIAHDDEKKKRLKEKER